MTDMNIRELPVLSVSQITGLIKETLEGGFRGLSVEGEVSNYRPASSGHVYFNLKDQDAMIACVLFRNAAARLSFSPRDGQKVRINGDLSVYARRGNYQIVVSRMVLAGEGEILAMLEERKRRLAREGLFDQERKRPLPLFPARIAVVTSPTGAAVRDILQVLRRRHSGVSVTILPAAVQGEGAAEQIVRGIRTANIHELGDVLIIGRGGGSLEDLLPFSEESVVRAVAESGIPVISAVGHEIDWALSDFAADLRAPTPSAAAEIVSASRDELLNRARSSLRHLLSGIRARTGRAGMLVQRFSPEYMERTLRQKIQPILQRLDDDKEEIIDALRQRLKDYSHRIALSSERLRSGSPGLIMQKGYAMVKHGGRILTDSTEAAPGDGISVRLFRGSLEATIDTLISPDNEEKNEGI
ncbi:exodeoxyribonuclease VII large subunit [Marispirochaeta aestuarii]|uniref:exodeoxyribonuclease VII large subunit n=1 Tax=Marispirochaeta aestuarii TaxID=1963862 RepID=UPI0029C6FE56|nr:exodeoxyribonuclease VII large subunit [Marispirochaeta aestuarii]